VTVAWDDELDAIFAGDLTAALGYCTPAGGVVVQATAQVGLRDREKGTLGFTTSLGFSKKLGRIAADPRVAMAYHAREHGTATGTRYVLAQGTARVLEHPTQAERDLVRAKATVHLGPPAEGVFWNRWLREYHVTRVPVEVTVTRILTWPALDAAGMLEPGAADQSGIALRCATPLPPGGRRAGLLGHTYSPRLIGLDTRRHTGWLEVSEDAGARYAPHTEVDHRAPANKTLLLLLNGALAKKGVRQAAKGARTG
jgi:Pyridoxamine 5'-phosphate oxidase